MPQLNPAPWFMTLLAVWFIALFLLKPTLMCLRHTTPPTPPALPPHSNPWTWSWH